MSTSYKNTYNTVDYQTSLADFLLQSDFDQSHSIYEKIQVPESAVDEDLRLRDRLSVYRNNVIHSLTEALAAQFPIVKRLVGDSFFLALARDYARQHPPLEPSLTFYGDQFCNFIAEHEHCQQIPYLADVAKLELCCQHCLHSADDVTLQAEELGGLAEDQFGLLQLKLRQSVRIFTSKFGAVDIWQENLQANPGQLDLTNLAESKAVLYRQNFQVKVIKLRHDVYFLLQEIQKERTINEAFEACQADSATSEEGFSDMLGFLLGLGIFSRYQLKEH